MSLSLSLVDSLSTKFAARILHLIENKSNFVDINLITFVNDCLPQLVDHFNQMLDLHFRLLELGLIESASHVTYLHLFRRWQTFATIIDIRQSSVVVLAFVVVVVFEVNLE
jgi:cytochrome c oxidase subunit IV